MKGENWLSLAPLSHAQALSPRMRLLLDSAVQVLAAHGLRGLTHRAVDAQAGLPQGSCSAYLRTRQALLTALATYVVTGVREEIAAMSLRLDGEPDTERATVETGAMFAAWLNEPNTLLARLELSLEATRSPELAAVFAEQRAALTDLVTDLIARSRPDVAAELADTLIAALDGVLIEGFRKSTKAQRDEFITRALRTLLTSTVAPTIS